jgi:hypothetical protein
LIGLPSCCYFAYKFTRTIGMQTMPEDFFNILLLPIPEGLLPQFYTYSFLRDTASDPNIPGFTVCNLAIRYTCPCLLPLTDINCPP